MSADHPNLARMKEVEPSFVGLTEAEAISLARDLGVELRIRRGASDALTLDLRANRVTIEVREGRVRTASAG